MIYPEVGEKGRRKTTSGQENENILLLYLRGRNILRDSIPRTGMKANKKKMSCRHQTNSRRYHRWCVATES